MVRPSKDDVVAALLDRHGQTYAAEAGIRLQDAPAPLFQLLCLSLLLSARIRADAAIAATRALVAEGWTTAQSVADSTWDQRVQVLNRSGYARYDESTSRMLGQTAGRLLDRYDGDLRRVRDDADHDPDEERRLLQQFSGIGTVGAAIFSREVQAVWEEMYPFADRRALSVAERLGLGSDVATLRALADDARQLSHLVAALVRCGLEGDDDEILEIAGGRGR
jgi:endonuclease III